MYRFLYLKIIMILLQYSQEATSLRPLYASVTDIQAALRSGTSCRTIMNSFLRRVNTFNGRLRAVITTNPSLQRDSELIDYQRARGYIRPLDCVPMLIKDNIDTAGIRTTVGAYTLVANIPSLNAFIIQKMIENGAITLGKANMAEYADCGVMSRSSTGGLARNPFDRTKTTSGSSGGTGAGIAAGFSVIGFGTDTEGSIIGPSTRGGIFGLRPTQGLLPATRIFPASPSMDAAGPMAKHARDIAFAWEAMNGDIAKSVNGISAGVSGVNIGILLAFLKDIKIEIGGQTITDYKPDALLVSNIHGPLTKGLRSTGAVVKNVSLSAADEKSIQDLILAFSIQKGETCNRGRQRDALETYFSTTPWRSLGNWTSVSDFSTPQFTGYDPTKKFFPIAAADLPPPEDSCATWDGIRADMQVLMGRVMDEAGVDVLVWPAAGSDPLPVAIREFCPNPKFIAEGSPANSISAVSAWPTLVMPIGYSSRGFPYTVQLFARRETEDLLIRIAAAWEDANIADTSLTEGGLLHEPKEAPELANNQP